MWRFLPLENDLGKNLVQLSSDLLLHIRKNILISVKPFARFSSFIFQFFSTHVQAEDEKFKKKYGLTVTPSKGNLTSLSLSLHQLLPFRPL